VTPFAVILKKVVDSQPFAVGGAFAAYDGEMVDQFTKIDKTDFAVITAHYGVILSQLKSMFGMWHFGLPEYFVAQHEKLDVFVHAVDLGYYALLAYTQPPEDFTAALAQMQVACFLLKKEMS
jgi:hypothetical protein